MLRNAKRPYDYLQMLLLSLSFVLAVCNLAFAQIQEIGSFRINSPNRKTISIPFKLVHNLMIIPMRINGSDTLNFILDSGVSTTVITSLPHGADVNLRYTKKIELSGLGEGDKIEALYSSGNTLQLRGATGINHEVLFLIDDVFHLSSSMGVHVHGLVGFDVFNNFIVNINYAKKSIELSDPRKTGKKYRKKKNKRNWATVPILIEKEKPYIDANIVQDDSSSVNVKLLVDSGASHALSLYYTTDEGLKVANNTFRSYLGAGLSGEIHGHVGRILSLELAGHHVKKPIVAYPDEEGIKRALIFSDRNGSIGAEILRRFQITMNYKDGTMLVKPSSNFHDDFSYNMSGIEVSTPFPGLPVYEIAQVRANSPAKKAGLAEGDQIVMINGVKAQQFTLNEIVSLLQSRSGRKIKLYVQRRYGDTYKAEFVLKDRI